MSKQVAMTKDIKGTIGRLGDAELDMLGLSEMAGDAAVNVPLVAGKDALLHLHLLCRPAVVADDARHEQLPEAGGHHLETTADKINQVLDRLLRGAIIGLH